MVGDCPWHHDMATHLNNHVLHDLSTHWHYLFMLHITCHKICMNMDRWCDILLNKRHYYFIQINFIMKAVFSYMNIIIFLCFQKFLSCHWHRVSEKGLHLYLIQYLQVRYYHWHYAPVTYPLHLLHLWYIWIYAKLAWDLWFALGSLIFKTSGWNRWENQGTRVATKLLLRSWGRAADTGCMIL